MGFVPRYVVLKQGVAQLELSNFSRNIMDWTQGLKGASAIAMFWGLLTVRLYFCGLLLLKFIWSKIGPENNFSRRPS